MDFLFEPLSAQSLADKLKLYMALSSDEKVQFGRNSRKLVEEKFDERLVIKQYEETITQIVDK